LTPRIGAASQEAVDGRSGRQLYEAACAACHGRDGKGVSRTIVGFETPLPDFTNCSFVTPEPDADWMAVIHQGRSRTGVPIG
jgi:hypothetical protein